MKTCSVVLILMMAWANLIGQVNFDIKKYNIEKEKILNVVINSIHFDSIYSGKKVYFVENELLSKETPIKLKRKWCKVRILEKQEIIEKGKQYAGIGDFTMDRENPQVARVQIFASPNYTLNLGLKKEKDKWTITNHFLMED